MVLETKRSRTCRRYHGTLVRATTTSRRSRCRKESHGDESGRRSCVLIIYTSITIPSYTTLHLIRCTRRRRCMYPSHNGRPIVDPPALDTITIFSPSLVPLFTLPGTGLLLCTFSPIVLVVFWFSAPGNSWTLARVHVVQPQWQAHKSLPTDHLARAMRLMSTLS